MFTNKIWLSIILTIVVFSGLFLYGDIDQVMFHIKLFPINYFIVAIALTTFNYLLRFLRWEYYLRTLQIKVPTTESVLIFIAGLGMSLTPWKIGEVLKGYFLQKRHQISVSITAPVVFMERVELCLPGMAPEGQADGCGQLLLRLLLLFLQPQGHGY